MNKLQRAIPTMVTWYKINIQQTNKRILSRYNMILERKKIK